MTHFGNLKVKFAENLAMTPAFASQHSGEGQQNWRFMDSLVDVFCLNLRAVGGEVFFFLRPLSCELVRVRAMCFIKIIDFACLLWHC